MEIKVSWVVDASKSYSRSVSVGACLERLVVCVSMLKRSLQVAEMLLQSHEEKRERFAMLNQRLFN